jgi:DNA-directed RNA polymerase subunit RPC12/RpoP
MIDKTIVELNKIFDYLNTKFYESKLTKPVILVQASGKKRNTLGWCTVNKIWKDKEEKNENYEITICAEHLNRQIPDIIATMLHEMVHLSNIKNEIKDCSNNNVYHNKRFKETAEAVGLLVDKGPIVGWGFTSLSDKLREELMELIIDEKAFEYFRKTPPKISTKVPLFKHVCEECGQKFTLPKKVNVICENCGKKMEIIEKE